MAELLTATRSEVARQAGQKAHPTAYNRVRSIVVSTPATWTGANGDTAATDLVIPAGSRILCPVIVSSAAGTASTTMSVGIRDAVTKVAIDATAIVNAVSIASAATAAVFTGTKLITGQEYYVPSDAEVYLTFGGATPLANQAIRVEISFVSP